LKTDRLLINALTVNDTAFIKELVNSKGWLKFIGNRNVSNEKEAAEYIQKILVNTTTKYWVVRLHESIHPIGVVTLIKRNYLDHQDIGFAFLPQFANKGYAFEATKTVINSLLVDYPSTELLATTISSNLSSIKLLKRLGFRFTNELAIEGSILQVYCISIN
jgi:ribosomal-protein-alanine N-acetyltransferase